jgi:hypothetical protein
MSNYCCSMHFKCVDCPIITSADCMAPGNLMPGQLYYNPCNCTYYFDAAGCEESGDECCGYQALNHKAGAGILYSGDCELGSYISVHIDQDAGFEFTEDGALTINCERLIDHCGLWTRTNLTFNSQDFSLVCDGDGNCVLHLNPETPFVRVRNAGELASAGVCVMAQPTTFTAGGDPDAGISSHKFAVLRMRDLTWIAGGGLTPLGIASHLSETITNTWSTPAFLEVSMIAQCNMLSAEADGAVGFIHAITDQLNVDPPTFGGGNNPALPNWAYTVVENNMPSFGVDPTKPWDGPGSVFTPQTSSCVYSRILAPGETVTIYYQWFAVFSERYDDVVNFALHGGMATSTKLFRNVQPL